MKHDLSNLPHVKDTDIVTRWRGSLVNTLLDAVRDLGTATDKRKTQSVDQLSWIRCYSDDEVPIYGVVEIYDGRMFSDGLVLRVRKPTSTAALLGANEQYALHAGTYGWIKVVNPYEAVKITVDPASDDIPFLGGVDVSATEDYTVESGVGDLMRSLVAWPYDTSWGLGTGTGVVDAELIPVIGVADDNVNICHGIVIEQCDQVCSLYRVQRVHMTLSPECDNCTGTGTGTAP